MTTNIEETRHNARTRILFEFEHTVTSFFNKLLFAYGILLSSNVMPLAGDRPRPISKTRAVLYVACTRRENHAVIDTKFTVASRGFSATARLSCR